MKSKSSSRLIDERVFLSMAICTAIAVTVLAFRFKNHEPCAPVEISVKSGPLYAGELIQFKAFTNNKEENIQWDFGDNSEKQEDEYTVSHRFKKPGRYEVYLNTNNLCETFKTIYVLETPLIEGENSRPTFSGPRTVEVGSPAEFIDSTPNATNWEWRFGETNHVDATGRRVHYTFNTPGPKNVILTVNGDKVGEFSVLITPQTFRPKPQPSRPRRPNQVAENLPTGPLPIPTEELKEPEKIFPIVSKEEIHKTLVGMVEGNKTVADLLVFLCEQDMRVNYNTKQITLDELYKELKEIRRGQRIRELNPDFEIDPKTNCIKSLKILLKKKGLLG